MINLLILAVAFHAATATPFDRIYGGQPTNVSRIPYLVTVLQGDVHDLESHLCQGSLISNRHVLSSCLCFLNRNGTYKVELGISHLEVSGIIVNVENITFQPGFQQMIGANSLCILRLAETVAFNEDIRPIPVSNRTNISAYSRGLIGGFGPSENPNNQRLNAVNVTLIPHAECRRRAEIANDQICSARSAGPCLELDRGSGLAQDGELIAVFTRKRGECGSRRSTNIYTKTGPAKQWIDENSRTT